MKYPILRQLEPLAEGIRDSDEPYDDLVLRNTLASLYQELDEALRVVGIRSGKRIDTGYGYAIAPFNAGYCLLDTDRTFSFMKGLINAVEEAKKRFPSQKIHILYAGTGPFASLVLPLTQLYSPDEIKITALDIHPQSTLFLKKLVQELQLEAYFCDYLTKNACFYDHEGEPVTILLSETMAAGLMEEPQAAVFQNLESCVHPDGFLIPEKIRLWASAAIMENNHSKVPNKTELGEVLLADRNWYKANPLDRNRPTHIDNQVPVPQHELNRQTFLETDIQVYNSISIADRSNKMKSCSPLKVPLTLSPAWRDDRDRILNIRFPLGGTRDELRSWIA
jgi:hypothetical protein